MTAFQGTTMAHSPLGNSKALEYFIFLIFWILFVFRSLDVKTLADFKGDLCKPVRMVLSCAGGGFNHDTLHRIAEKHFGHLSNRFLLFLKFVRNCPQFFFADKKFFA